MFDGFHGGQSPEGQDFSDARFDNRSVAVMDPVELLQMLEERLAHSEQALQEQISRLHVRVSRLERDVQDLAGDGKTDVRSLEREVNAIADRLTRLEERAA